MTAAKKPESKALAVAEAKARAHALREWLASADPSDIGVRRRIALAWKGAHLDHELTESERIIVRFVAAIEAAARAQKSRQLSDAQAVLLATNNFGGGTVFVSQAGAIPSKDYLAAIAVALRRGRPAGAKTEKAKATQSSTVAKREVYARAISHVIKVDVDAIKRAFKKVGRPKV